MPKRLSAAGKLNFTSMCLLRKHFSLISSGRCLTKPQLTHIIVIGRSSEVQEKFSRLWVEWWRSLFDLLVWNKFIRKEVRFRSYTLLPDAGNARRHRGSFTRKRATTHREVWLPHSSTFWRVYKWYRRCKNILGHTNRSMNLQALLDVSYTDSSKSEASNVWDYLEKNYEGQDVEMISRVGRHRRLFSAFILVYFGGPSSSSTLIVSKPVSSNVSSPPSESHLCLVNLSLLQHSAPSLV